MNLIKNHKSLCVIVGITLFVAIIYSVAFCRGLDFWDNLIGVAIALIIGIPIALAVDKEIKTKEAKVIEVHRTKRECEVVKFLKQELQFNKGLLESGRDIFEIDFHPIQIEMWEVLKSSGELVLIRDMDLLNRITSAYDIAIKIKHFQEKALDEWNPRDNFSNLDSNWATQRNRARAFHLLFVESVDEALRQIEIRLNKIIK